MFRIDKTLVSYERSEVAYTNIGTVLGSAYNRAGEEQATEEERTKAQVPEKIEAQCQEKIAKAEKEAKAVLFDAEKKARYIMQQAQAEAAGANEEAQEKGYRDGLLKAEREIQERLGKQTEMLNSLIAQVGAARETMMDELEGDIITLVFEIAKKVINIELEKNDKVFVDLVQNALGEMKREGKIVVRVGQDDYARYFSSGSAEFIFNNEHIKTTVIEEPLFKKGDCVIESDGETINAGINSQLKYIELAFRNEESHIA